MPVPAGDVAGRNAAREEEASADEQGGTTALMEYLQRQDVSVDASAIERGPCDPVPSGNSQGDAPPCGGEQSAGVQRRTIRLVEHRKGADLSVETIPERRPLPSVPSRDAVGRDPARLEEVPCGIQRRPAAIVEDRHGEDGPVGAAAHRGPGMPVPAGDVGGGKAARREEETAGVQSRAGPVVELHQTPYFRRHPRISDQLIRIPMRRAILGAGGNP